VITVGDSGQGIPSDFLPFVFDRFRQGEQGTTRNHTGLGLGLSVVRHLVELHGGSVSVDSKGAGKGSTFTVRLPLRFSEQRAKSA
jgi:signal transduction histidine kinase